MRLLQKEMKSSINKDINIHFLYNILKNHIIYYL